MNERNQKVMKHMSVAEKAAAHFMPKAASVGSTGFDVTQAAMLALVRLMNAEPAVNERGEIVAGPDATENAVFVYCRRAVENHLSICRRFIRKTEAAFRSTVTGRTGSLVLHCNDAATPRLDRMEAAYA